MKWTPVPIACDANEADVRPKSVMVPINYLTVIAKGPGERSDASLQQLPGCTVFADLGTDAPIRGLYNCEGSLYAVSGTSLFRVTAGTLTTIGTIPGRKRVTFAHNQITGGNQIVIATGSTAYVFNTKTDTLTQITDEGFPGAKVVAFVDGYIDFVDPLGRYWGHSSLANALEYNTLDRSEAESQPDKIVGMAVSHREVVIFGERTTEFYRNDGGTEGAFERINGTELEIGCAATHSVVKLDNSVYWLANDGTIRRLANGYQPEIISTQSIEEKIARWNQAEAFAFSYEQPGHKIFYITFTDGYTLGYDVATGLWHRRKSYGMDFWRMGAMVKWNNAWIGGDYANGKLYQLVPGMSNDAGEPLERIARFAVAHDDGNRFTIDAIRFWMNTGETDESDPLPQLIVVPPDDPDEEIPPLSIVGTLGPGTVGTSYADSLQAVGGVPPYVSWEIISGSLPPGLNDDTTVGENYNVTGTPT